MNNKKKIFKVTMVGVFAALVFVSNYISIPIPVAVGDITRIHIANGLCLLSGLVLGPVGGGLSAGIGSGLYDLTFPAYIASSPFTFAFKFLMAFTAGAIAYSGKREAKKVSFNIIGCVSGQIVYIILYLGKSYITGLLEGSAPGALVPSIITKLGTSSVNGLIACIIAVPLCLAVKAALKKSRLMD